jgi:hypothetical protein
MSIINRHNYEAYFILYVDNELSSDHRGLVEQFLQKNPDLAEELTLLQQFKLVPESNITFTHKQELFKNHQTAAFTSESLPEDILLYIDDELSPLQKKRVEKLITNSPILQKDLHLLQQAKLPKEEISCPNKNWLYKKKENVRRIIPFWWRVTASILFTVALVSSIYITRKQKTATTTASITKNTAPTISKEVNEQAIKLAPKSEVPLQIAPIIKTNALQKNSTSLATQNKLWNNLAAAPTNSNKPKELITINAPRKLYAVVNHKQTETNLSIRVYTPLLKVKEPQNEIVKNDAPEKIITDPNNSLTDVFVTKKESTPFDNTTATLIEEENSGKKSKSRGLFRKIARNFEKRTNIDPTDGDGRLLVAGFAFKTR